MEKLLSKQLLFKVKKQQVVKLQFFMNSGGSFNYQDKITYNSDMMNSTLELRATAKLKDKEQVLSSLNELERYLARMTMV